MVETKTYVANLKKESPIVKAKKTGFVLARLGIEGEKIETYVSNGTLETTNTVKVDENGNVGIIVTMVDKNKKAIVDNNGHTNTYIIPRKTFDSRYINADKVNENEQIFEVAGVPQDFIQIKEDIEIMASWGEVQALKAGAYLNVTNESDVYGIAEEEFKKTYCFI